MDPNHQRIALVSDIHANLPALQAVLAYCDSHPPVNLILNLGDMIGIGPHPQEVFDLVMADPRFINITGNHEISVSESKDIKGQSEEENHYLWVRETLGQDRVQKLCEFPQIHTLKIEDRSLFLVHSRKPPANMAEMPLLFQGKPLSEFRNDYPTAVDFVIFGHIHQQFLLQDATPIFICPGSVGCAKLSTAVASFAILDLWTSYWDIKFLQVPYDLSKVLTDLDNRNVPDRIFIKHQFFNERKNLYC